MTSQQIPVSILRKSCNILETLTNLIYLAEMEADDPQKVRTYLSLSKRAAAGNDRSAGSWGMMGWEATSVIRRVVALGL